MKRVLMVAFHFPPLSISSGIQRTLKFATYLPELQWEPSVLTAHPRAYDTTADDQMSDIPEKLTVRRAFSLNTSRHLSIAGHHPVFLSLPDKWSTWWPGAVASGLRMIRQAKPDIIWSTYPIATAHLIGLTLHRLTGIPWVADCRDSITEDNYPRQKTVRRAYLWIEHQMVRHAARIVFTSPGTLELYAARYPDVPRERWAIVENGYDEGNFAAANGLPGKKEPTGRITLVHSGILYPSERDPTQLFDALAELKREGRIAASRICIRLRGTRYDHLFKAELERRGISDIVELAPPIGYEAALNEMLAVDGLVIVQASNCNHQTPAKLYEYFRARRPVLGLTDPKGDTAREMRKAGLDAISALDDKNAIKTTLLAFLEAVSTRSAAVASERAVIEASRQHRTAQLAAVLGAVASG
jgi:hypothetical protein